MSIQHTSILNKLNLSTKEDFEYYCKIGKLMSFYEFVDMYVGNQLKNSDGHVDLCYNNCIIMNLYIDLTQDNVYIYNESTESYILSEFYKDYMFDMANMFSIIWYKNKSCKKLD